MPPKRPLPDDPNAPRQPQRPPPPLNFSKARACEACRRHKIKCEWVQGQANCVKCERSGFECTVTDGTQRFLEEDTTWKSETRAQLLELQAAVSHILKTNNLPELASYRALNHVSPRGAQGLPPVPKENAPNGTSPSIVVPSIDMTRENSQEPQPDSSDIVPAPMKSLYSLTRLHVLGSNSGRSNQTFLEEDFISRNVITLKEAEELWNYYYDNMNQYLWGGILLLHNNLRSCRQSSPMLAAVVLTVAAIHLPHLSKDLMERCYAEFVSLTCANALSRHHSLDDIRSLALGAFYLPTLSWKLSGQAVRIATELNLHRSFQTSHMGTSQMPGDHEKARLWCMLFVCDCQFSIAYGRPPVTIEDSTIRNYEQFLEGPKAVSFGGDIRLSAQVALFRVMTEAYQKFGPDESVLSDDDFSYIRRFNMSIDEWRLSWQRRSADNIQIGNYPSLIIALYYYFAKFQINSLAFRGIGTLQDFSMGIERKEAANASIAACLGTLALITDEPDMRSALRSVPIFTHTMIAFSATFLLQVAARWTNSNALSIEARHVLGHVERVAALLNEVKETVQETHLTRHIAKGLRKLLDNFRVLDVDPYTQFPKSEPVTRVGSAMQNPYNYQQPPPPPPTFDGRIPEYPAFSNDARSNSFQADATWPWLMNDVRGTYGFGFDEQILNPFASDGTAWY